MESENSPAANEHPESAGPSQVHSDPGFEATALQLLTEMRHAQAEIAGTLERLQVQNSALIQQSVGLNAAVSNLSGAAKASKPASPSDAHRAMAGVLGKLFRDLLKPLNQLDAMLDVGDPTQLDPGDAAWIESMQMLRNGFEQVLAEWSCRVVSIDVEKQIFDPEIHEALSQESRPDLTENTIVRVSRRGWKLLDATLQFPQVIVSTK